MGRQGKRSKAAKKARAAEAGNVLEEAFAKSPHTFVYHQGRVGSSLRSLVRDCRRIFEPYTASKLKVSKHNTLQDLIKTAGLLHVTHFLSFTKTAIATYLRVLGIPNGPTITFKVQEYSLSNDVLSSQRHPDIDQNSYQFPPLLVMNNLSGECEFRLIGAVFQSMIPSIDVNTVSLKNIRRIVLFNMNKETKIVHMRHYLIRAAPSGIHKTTRKLLRPHMPDLSRFRRMEEFVELGDNVSESEAEVDGVQRELVLPQDVRGRGNVRMSQSAIRLKEVGPRMTLQLVKIESEVSCGEVLFHAFITKTAEEKRRLSETCAEKRQLKEHRILEQKRNVMRKAERMQERLQRRKDKGVNVTEQKRRVAERSRAVNNDVKDNDAAYFQEEVGKAPDEGLGLASGSRTLKRKDTSSVRCRPEQKKYRKIENIARGKKTKLPLAKKRATLSGIKRRKR